MCAGVGASSGGRQRRIPPRLCHSGSDTTCWLAGLCCQRRCTAPRDGFRQVLNTRSQMHCRRGRAAPCSWEAHGSVCRHGGAARHGTRAPQARDGVSSGIGCGCRRSCGLASVRHGREKEDSGSGRSSMHWERWAAQLVGQPGCSRSQRSLQSCRAVSATSPSARPPADQLKDPF